MVKKRKLHLFRIILQQKCELKQMKKNKKLKRFLENQNKSNFFLFWFDELPESVILSDVNKMRNDNQLGKYQQLYKT